MVALAGGRRLVGVLEEAAAPRGEGSILDPGQPAATDGRVAWVTRGFLRAVRPLLQPVEPHFPFAPTEN